MLNRSTSLLAALLLCFSGSILAESSPERIQSLIKEWRTAARGPYRDIMWFCDDGTFVRPRTTGCTGEGVQRARYSDGLLDLQRTDHLYLAQILSTTDRNAFWDAQNYNSRLKQYLLGKFLQYNDNGWVLESGQFYRGAFQIEDEVEWGEDFLRWVAGSNSNLTQHWFLLRQAAKTIPHGNDDDRSQRVRALSKSIADNYSKFMDLRIKIHGQPSAEDLPNSRAFFEKHGDKLSQRDRTDFEAMLADMEVLYAPVNIQSLRSFQNLIPAGAVRTAVEELIRDYDRLPDAASRVTALAEMLATIRDESTAFGSARGRLALLDLSNILEGMLLREIPEWTPVTVGQTAAKNCELVTAAYGTGFINPAEREKLAVHLPVEQSLVTWQQLSDHLSAAQRAVEWGAGTVRGVFYDVVSQYSEFEPLAYGYYDDIIRSSVLLPLGTNIGKLSEYLASTAGLRNEALDLENGNQIRGINPGYARGELVVVTGDAENLTVDKNKIYAFERPPSDLKPVAGILTVTEGNMVSHVSLLARNLGIPNAVISPENLSDLKRYHGEELFYAVSNTGTVIVRRAKDMDDREKALFAERTRNENKVTVPTEKMDLSQRSVLNMRDVKSKDSGKIVGPKAANLGQLKEMFPDQVVEGVVIPFGIFREHLDQRMTTGNKSYWEHLNGIFAEARALEKQGADEQEIEAYQVRALADFQQQIQQIPLLPSFERDFRNSFQQAFGQPLGRVPVFLRSDTNMEDLEEFTGAGLNLTLFNVLDADEILNGIKKVWASPYSERSFKWRQRYLLNPENVFPSILVIPSVNVDKSGVLITKGVSMGTDDDLTVAFSRGVGGAVDGQSAETYLLRPDGSEIMLSPARDPQYRTIPPSGGSTLVYATFDDPVLAPKDREDLRRLAADVNERLPKAPGINTNGPWDVELGFKDGKIWLFQVRPFVENKNAKTSEYLESITPRRPVERLLRTSAELDAEDPGGNFFTQLLRRTELSMIGDRPIGSNGSVG